MRQRMLALCAVLLLACTLWPQRAAAQPAAQSTFDLAAQAAALVPESRGDLQLANGWNRYSLNAAIDPDARTISGQQRLEYTNRDSVPLDRLYFHLYPNLSDFGGKTDINAVTVDGQSVPPAYETGRYLLRVNLPTALQPGVMAAVTLDFVTRAPLNASTRLYGPFNKENGVLALASATPIMAIVRGGVWDIARPNAQGDFVNSETALYDVTLAVPTTWSIVTTGVMIDEQEQDRTRTARYVSGPQRDFTIALVQLAKASAEVDGTLVTSYYRPGSETGGKAALDTAVRAVRLFNARYGRYPLRELDVIDVDCRSFYGVEYPGLIMIDHQLYRQPALLESIVAHEVAHQWWYSIVGNDVQRASWVDEALASYSQVIYQEAIHGPQAAQKELNEFRQRFRTARANGRDAVVDQPNANFRGNYVSMVYGKAVLFFQALRVRIGDAAFNQFLQRYYAQNRYGYVGGTTMLADAEAACACDLDGLYHDWITAVVPLTIP